MSQYKLHSFEFDSIQTGGMSVLCSCSGPNGIDSVREPLRPQTRGSAVGAIVVLMLLVLSVHPVKAVTCTFNGTGFIVKSKDTVAFEFGARVAFLRAENPSPACVVLRAMYVIEDAFNLVEVGWYQDGSSQSLDKCTNTLTPHVLVAAATNNFWKCKTGTAALAAGQEYSFRVDNPNHDLEFEYYWDTDSTPDAYLGFYGTFHTSGTAEAVDEKHSAGAYLKADFDDFDSRGSGGSWHNFPLPTELVATGDVSGWSVCSWSSNHLMVRQTGNCP